jgi:hypothetical protein
MNQRNLATDNPPSDRNINVQSQPPHLPQKQGQQDTANRATAHAYQSSFEAQSSASTAFTTTRKARVTPPISVSSARAARAANGYMTEAPVSHSGNASAHVHRRLSSTRERETVAQIVKDYRRKRGKPIFKRPNSFVPEPNAAGRLAYASDSPLPHSRE